MFGSTVKLPAEKVFAADAGKAEMVAVPKRAGTRQDRLQSLQIVVIQRINASDRKVYPMRDDRPAPRAQVQHRLRKPPEVHEVFGNDLQPADHKKNDDHEDFQDPFRVTLRSEEMHDEAAEAVLLQRPDDPEGKENRRHRESEIEIGVGAAEPTLAITKDGTVSYAPIFSPDGGVGVYQSKDFGVTWTTASPNAGKHGKQHPLARQ